ncbi:hypothetical protein ACJRO7_003382 [Eucalyptus globulus]|uniref:Uncharacterized protein n=1 Tax=Eucalyptus globulus TaxID=34317 RepID=A0ABD3IXP2_EUCGL
MASGDEEASSVPRRHLSCTTYFNALWFCSSLSLLINFVFDPMPWIWPAILPFLFSSVHKMQQYYWLGVLDNYLGKWSALVDCLALKTKRESEVHEILETHEKAKHRIRTFRTPEKASSHWKELFAHLDEPE